MNKISAFTSFIEEKIWFQPNFDMELINQNKKFFTIGIENEFTSLKEKIFTCTIFSGFVSGHIYNTIESYYIDKIYSNRLDISKIKIMTDLFLKKAEEKIEEGKNWNLSEEIILQRDSYYVTFINDYFDYIGTDRDEKMAQLRELYFMSRIISRLNVEEMSKITKKMFHEGALNLHISQSLRNEILQAILEDYWSHDSFLYTNNLSDEAKKEYYTFCNTLFLERDKAIYAFLKENLEKDIQARMKNPKARLLALSTLASYEKEIRRKKIIAVVKIIAIALLGILIVGSAYFVVRSIRFFYNKHTLFSKDQNQKLPLLV